MNPTFTNCSADHYISRARSWQSTSHAKKIRLQANTIACKYGISISDYAWSCYAELHALREEGCTLTKENEFRRFNKIWDSFCKSDRFGLAVAVNNYVCKVDPWA